MIKSIDKTKQRGCPSCKHYRIGQIRIFEDDIPRSCGAGHAEVFEQWWKENGHKTTEPCTNNDCWEITESSKKLDEMRGLVKQMREIIKSTNDE